MNHLERTLNQSLESWENRKKAIILTHKGAYLVKDRKYKEALNCFNNAIEIDTNVDGAWFGKAMALMNLQRFEEAKDAFDEAISIEPNEEIYKSHRWMCLKILGIDK